MNESCNWRSCSDRTLPRSCWRIFYYGRPTKSDPIKANTPKSASNKEPSVKKPLHFKACDILTSDQPSPYLATSRHQTKRTISRSLYGRPQITNCMYTAASDKTDITKTSGVTIQARSQNQNRRGYQHTNDQQHDGQNACHRRHRRQSHLLRRFQTNHRPQRQQPILRMALRKYVYKFRLRRNLELAKTTIPLGIFSCAHRSP